MVSANSLLLLLIQLLQYLRAITVIRPASHLFYRIPMLVGIISSVKKITCLYSCFLKDVMPFPGRALNVSIAFTKRILQQLARQLSWKRCLLYKPGNMAPILKTYRREEGKSFTQLSFDLYIHAITQIPQLYTPCPFTQE